MTEALCVEEIIAEEMEKRKPQIMAECHRRAVNYIVFGPEFAQHIVDIQESLTSSQL